jgi:hypothetical protein
MTIEVRDRHEIIIRQSPDSQTNIRDASKKEVHELHKHENTIAGTRTCLQRLQPPALPKRVTKTVTSLSWQHLIDQLQQLTDVGVWRYHIWTPHSVYPLFIIHRQFSAYTWQPNCALCMASRETSKACRT